MGEAQRERIMECRDGMARPWQDADGGSETVIMHKAVAWGRCNKMVVGREATRRLLHVREATTSLQLRGGTGSVTPGDTTRAARRVGEVRG